MSRRWPAAERIVAAFNVALAATWLAADTAVPVAPVLIALHGVAALLPALTDRAFSRGGHAPPVLRDLYPFFFVPAFWAEIGLLHAAMPAPRYDALAAALDRAVFGLHLNAIWAPAMPRLSEAMQVLYAGYYLAAFAPVLLLAALRRREALRDVVLALTATYVACYLVYLVLPVGGPLHTQPRFTDGVGDGFFFRLNDALHAFGDSEGTAFPSSHVAGAMAMALVAARRFPRALAWLVAAEAVGVCLSTVYTQNHYAIDVLAGLGVALGVHLALVAERRRLPTVAWSLRTEPFSGG